MKYVLIKVRELKLLVNEGLDMQPLLDNLGDIEALHSKVQAYQRNILYASKEEGQALDKEARNLISKIGYNIIGSPFTVQDAQLYALNEKLEYTTLEISD